MVKFVRGGGSPEQTLLDRTLALQIIGLFPVCTRTTSSLQFVECARLLVCCPLFSGHRGGSTVRQEPWVPENKFYAPSKKQLKFWKGLPGSASGYNVSKSGDYFVITFSQCLFRNEYIIQWYILVSFFLASERLPAFSWVLQTTTLIRKKDKNDKNSNSKTQLHLQVIFGESSHFELCVGSNQFVAKYNSDQRGRSNTRSLRGVSASSLWHPKQAKKTCPLCACSDDAKER